jgi:uncharacterized DUF497 family protein
MKQLKFEWDNTKDKTNTKKHGVTFDEARTVFYDEQSIRFYDPEYLEDKDRFILLGASFNLKTLVVCHCFKEDEAKIRIISARKADKEEEQVYWSNQKMKAHYDFANMKGKRNPFTKYLKQPVTMRLDCESVDYFKSLAKEVGVPYQTLINLYLRDCATHHRKLKMQWVS